MNFKRAMVVLQTAYFPLALFVLGFVLGAAPSSSAQSVLGSISGTVYDNTGAVVPRVKVLVHRYETNTDRRVSTDESGNYTIVNLDAGTYDITTSASGFETEVAKGIVLIARQQLHYNVTLRIGTMEQTVNVNASEAGVIETQSSQISAALTPVEVLSLPANYRGAGSTSPINVIQTLPGVQADTASYPPAPSPHPQPSLKFSLQGGLPSQTEVTVDGISAQNITNNNIQADAFPSAESVAEIRVDGVNNNAEYGQPGEITTVTKSGTKQLHGSAYEYFQNQALDATPFGANAATKPHKVANDFGVSLGGPVVIPHLYKNSDRTFFFGAYESLRYPQSTVLQALVPTAAMKQGEFAAETTTPLINPFTGGTYSGNVVPVNSSSAAFLQFYPDPNIGPAGESLAQATANRGYNYLSTRPNGINSDQGDFRGDQNLLGQRATLSGRYTLKDVNQDQAVDLALPQSTAYSRYDILATTFTYTFNPRVTNEFRFGFTLERDGDSNPFNGPAFLKSTNLNGVSAPFFNGIPYLSFNTIRSIGERLGYEERSRIFQYVDNLTWQHGNHVLRFGGDIRHMVAHTEAGGSTVSANYGNFFFNPSASTSTGDEVADFLIGVPEQSQISTIMQDNNGVAYSYNVYAQDSWQTTHYLTLNVGLRYELHPGFHSSDGLAGNFDPSVPQTGRLIYPDGYANTLSVQELADVNACEISGVDNPYANNQPGSNGAPCTPVVSNSQAGLPSSLRDTDTLRFMPRFGFAYRPFKNDRTAIRGGVSYYNITTTGALFYALSQTLQSNLQTFANYLVPGQGPAFAFPNTSTKTSTFAPSLGSVYFYATNAVKWHDPYSLQTNLSIDHDMGHNIGVRVSYVGMHTWHLIWQPQLNQLPKSATTMYSDPSRASQTPFSNFYQITTRTPGAISDYRALELEVSHRYANGFLFNSSYAWAKSLSDNQGSYGSYSGTSFVDEQGGYSPTDSFNPRQDYGNVSGTRRQHWLTTAIYELPFGRGKRYGSGVNRVSDLALGNWQLSNILMLQTGPYMSAYFPAGYIDPSGTGSGSYLGGAAQRPDLIGDPNAGPHSRSNWFNSNAFACPGQTTPYTAGSSCDVGIGSAPIGRFGTEHLGDLVGPGTFSLSSGLAKSFQIVENVSLHFEATFTNVLNHTNPTDPDLDLTQADFGEITSARGSDFGGSRTGQLSLKIQF
jgi:hypothetical protein